jgi:FAD/FMN-containing dehydrogenase
MAERDFWHPTFWNRGNPLKLNRLVMLFGVVSLNSAWANFLTDPIDYKRTLKRVNTQLSEMKDYELCPGMGLAISCGNQVCEETDGENEFNCPVDCSQDPVHSFNSQVVCKNVKKVLVPENSQEVRKIIEEASYADMRVRVVGRVHSMNDLICTDGIALSTARLNRILGIEKYLDREVVVVEPGVLLGDLAEWLHQRGKSLGYTLPGFRGVSVAGAVATASHGSSSKHRAVISSLVQSITLVTSNGKEYEYRADDTPSHTFKALRANLGTLGVMVKLKLEIQPQFNLHMKVESDSEQMIFKGKDLEGWLQSCDYSHLFWFPHAGRVTRVCGKETQRREDPSATSALLELELPGLIVKSLKVAMQYGSCEKSFNCLMEDLRYASFKVLPPYKKKDKHGNWVNTGDVVGPSHRMTSSEISDSFSRVPVTNWEIAIPVSRLKPILQKMAEEFRKQNTCTPISGVALRFAPAENTTLLSHTVALGDFELNEPVALIDLLVYAPAGFNEEQKRRFEAPYQEWIRKIIVDGEGRAHWGKNRNWVFKLQSEYETYGRNQRQFEKILHRFDPDGMFMNDLTDEVFK